MGFKKMSKSKVDKYKLYQMLKKGESAKHCAKYFNCSPGRISQIRKELNASVIKNVTLESAHRIVDKNLDAISQLQKINSDANEILDLLMRWNRGDEEALQILESQVATKKVRVGGKEEFVKEFKFKDPRELALKAMAEIRSQLNLQLDIFKSLYDMKAVQEFQQEVLSTIGEASPEVRNAIISRLNQRRIIRQSVKFD